LGIISRKWSHIFEKRISNVSKTVILRAEMGYKTVYFPTEIVICAAENKNFGGLEPHRTSIITKTGMKIILTGGDQ
jgi:hypothetical protein